DELCEIDFNAGENPGDKAGQDDSARDAAGGIVRFVSERGDAIEADVGEDSDGCAVKNCAGVEGGMIVEGIQEKVGGWVSEMEDPAHGGDENEHNDDAEGGSHSGVDSRGGFDAVAVED